MAQASGTRTIERIRKATQMNTTEKTVNVGVHEKTIELTSEEFERVLSVFRMLKLWNERAKEKACNTSTIVQVPCCPDTESNQ
jgi:hypothetical protein